MTPVAMNELPSRAGVLDELARAERAEGWMARCAVSGRYVALNRAFVDALAEALRPLVDGGAHVLEVCAGDGALAAALRRRGVAVVATDIDPPSNSVSVERLTAAEALSRYDPTVVLGSFVPFDAGVDRQILDHPRVRDYVVLNARLAGAFGADCLWTRTGWGRRRLSAVTASVVSRHDVWLGDEQPVRRLGEAWHLRRATDASDDAGTTQPELTR